MIKRKKEQKRQKAKKPVLRDAYLTMPNLVFKTDLPADGRYLIAEIDAAFLKEDFDAPVKNIIIVCRPKGKHLSRMIFIYEYSYDLKEFIHGTFNVSDFSLEKLVGKTIALDTLGKSSFVTSKICYAPKGTIYPYLAVDDFELLPEHIQDGVLIDELAARSDGQLLCTDFCVLHPMKNYSV